MPAWIMAMPETVASMPDTHTRLMVVAFRRVGYPRLDGCHPGQVHGRVVLEHVAEPHVVDDHGVDARPLDRFLHDRAREVNHMQVLEGPPKLPTAVRHADTMTTFFIMISLSFRLIIHASPVFQSG